MKKAFFILFFAGSIISCGNNNTSDSTSTNQKSTTETPKATASPEAQKGLELVGKNDCFTCHKIADPSVGPAYQLVANKYPVNDAVIDSLSQKIIKGGTGNWGSVPMTPHQALSKEDAKTMVQYILSLKQ